MLFLMKEFSFFVGVLKRYLIIISFTISPKVLPYISPCPIHCPICVYLFLHFLVTVNALINAEGNTILV